MIVIVIHPGYASGDQFSVSASMVLDNDVRVLVSTGRDGDQTDQGPGIVQFLRSALPTNQQDRVQLVTYQALRTTENQLKMEEAKTMAGRPHSALSNTQFRKQHLRDLTAVTRILGDTWRDDPDGCRSRVRAGWGLNDAALDLTIRTWLTAGYPRLLEHSGSQRLVVLWSRFSGKKGDVHLEHDTSFAGMRQLIGLALQSNNNNKVILTGDPPLTVNGRDTAARRQKYSQMVQGFFAERVFDLTAFWTQDMWQNQPRITQFKLYNYLHSAFHEVRHLGFRSGNLEAIAMIGVGHVRYLEESGQQAANTGGNRMVAFHGSGMGYERIQISRVPTRSGQYLYDDRQWGGPNWNDTRRRPAWAPGRQPLQPKPNQIRTGSYVKGFDATDLDGVIASYLNEASASPSPPRTPSPPPLNVPLVVDQLNAPQNEQPAPGETAVDLFAGDDAVSCWKCCVIQ